MKFLSIIIPAHNEAFELPLTLQSVFAAASAVGVPFEVMVVNDASTDRTGEIARAAGARVIDVHLRKISAVRNAGARVSCGDFLFFLDADTRLPAATLQAALRELERGAAGGGAWVGFSDCVGVGVRLALGAFSLIYLRGLRWAAGCFLFVRRSAFEAVGGFDERLFACEEIAMSIALKRQGPWVILREHVATSARKLRFYSPWRSVVLLWRFLRYGRAVFQRREGLEWWYEGRRDHAG